MPSRALTASPREPARRSDVVRNEQRLLAAATTVLGHDPAATMLEIADAAGLTRATVYRHYASREALVAAIREAAESEIAGLVADLPGTGPALEPLLVLAEASLRLGLKYRFLVLVPQQLDETPALLGAHTGLARFLVRAQRRGDLDPQYDPGMAAHLVVGLLNGLLPPLILGHIEFDSAVTHARRALTKALT